MKDKDGKALPYDPEKTGINHLEPGERKPVRINGRSYNLTDTEIAKHKALLIELNGVLRSRQLSNVPLDDPYYETKKKLDEFIKRLGD